LILNNSDKWAAAKESPNFILKVLTVYNNFKLSGDTKGDWGIYDHPPLLVSVG